MQGRLAKIAPGFISDQPFFTVEIGQLKSPSQWQWPWPGSCVQCVDLRLAGKNTSSSVWLLVISDPRYSASRNTTAIPHCLRHSKGVGVCTKTSGARLEFKSLTTLVLFAS